MNSFLFLHFVVCVVLALVSIPLILKRIPPNRLYGVRTAKTLSNSTTWYKVIIAVLLPRQKEHQSDAYELGPLALFIDNFSPIFFTAALFGLGFAIMREHFFLGMFSVIVTSVVHSLRSTILQTRYIRSERNLSIARDNLEKLSITDGLTGISNRRYFDKMLDSEWQHAQRSKTSLSLLMIDIDYFKSLNDEFGHPYGDTCLIKIAHALRSAIPRSIDLLARYGGEEFTVILPDTNQTGAELVAGKLKDAVSKLKIENAPSKGGIVTVSIGCAGCSIFLNSEPARLIAAADKALYRAKQNGRNRIEYESL